jgi:hypothetical protein
VQASLALRMDEEDDRRNSTRHPSEALATLRQRNRPNELIHLTDISALGCGFRLRWALPVGTPVWLGLPGLETWPATVAWCKDGKGGLRFDRPLHPLVAERFAAELGPGLRA